MTVTLPHTGLQAPHDRVRLMAPGLIEIDGEVTGIEIEPLDDFVEQPATQCSAFYDWALHCRMGNGDPLDLSEVFDYLRVEYRTGRALAAAAKAGTTVVQAMLPHGDDYLPGMTLEVEPDWTRQLTIEMTQIVGGPHGTWWRLYDGTGWVELDPK